MSRSIQPKNPAHSIPISTSREVMPSSSVTDEKQDQDGASSKPIATPTRAPLIDIHETDEGLMLEADVPGASDRTLKIHLEHNLLHLRASIDSAIPDARQLIQQEYPLFDFERTFILSDDIDRARISAEIKNGVLRLWLPRALRDRTRRIDVKSE